SFLPGADFCLRSRAGLSLKRRDERREDCRSTTLRETGLTAALRLRHRLFHRRDEVTGRLQSLSVCASSNRRFAFAVDRTSTSPNRSRVRQLAAAVHVLTALLFFGPGTGGESLTCESTSKRVRSKIPENRN